MTDDKVTAFPTPPERLARRVMHAKEEYAAALTAEAKDRLQAIRAVIEYGAGLLELREAYPANKDFAAWVAHYELDQGEPWGDRRERSAAMAIAAVDGTAAVNTFAGCPHTRPTHIMKWYRKQHPETVKRGRPKKLKLVKSKQGSLALNEEQQLAAAEFTPKGKLSIEKAIRLHKQRLEKQFQQRLGEEVRAQIAKANDATRKQNVELRKENHSLTLALRQQATFSTDDFRTILAVLHPDNSASPEKRALAFNLFKQKEKRLVAP